MQRFGQEVEDLLGGNFHNKFDLLSPKLATLKHNEPSPIIRHNYQHQIPTAVVLGSTGCCLQKLNNFKELQLVCVRSLSRLEP